MIGMDMFGAGGGGFSGSSSSSSSNEGGNTGGINFGDVGGNSMSSVYIIGIAAVVALVFLLKRK